MRLLQALLGPIATCEPFSQDHLFHDLQDEPPTLPMRVVLGIQELLEVDEL
jgi:hypothetical protein